MTMALDALPFLAFLAFLALLAFLAGLVVGGWPRRWGCRRKQDQEARAREQEEDYR